MPTTATVEAPAQKTDNAPTEKPVLAVPAPARPADPVQDIAKPADIMQPAGIVPPAVALAPAVTPEQAKPADTAAPAIKPEPPRPTIAAAPRRHNHVAVFISRKDKKLYVRHGYEPVFDTAVEIADADRPLGTHVFTARGDNERCCSAALVSGVDTARLRARRTPRSRRNRAQGSCKRSNRR